MSQPKSTHEEIEQLPAILRALLKAELAAGNEIVEVGHSFPAPPIGAYFKLAKPLLTRPQRSGDGIDYYDRNGSTYSGEITDAKRYFFLLEPPHPPEPEPDMNAIRAALDARGKLLRPASIAMPPSPIAKADPTPAVQTPVQVAAGTARAAPREKPVTFMQRFEASMVMDFDKWHDGTGYDLDALRAMSPRERKEIEARLIARGARDWRDIEALACLDTPEAQGALRAALNSGSAEARNAVTRCAPHLIPGEARTASLVEGLRTAVFYGGLTQTLDQVAEFHPPLIVDTLFRGALERAGDVAVHFAAMLCYIHGKAEEPFDMEQRPFFLRFNTENRAERERAFRDLCQRIGADAETHLSPGGSTPPSGPSETLPPRKE